MGKKPLPHDDIVREMREHVATATSLARRTISDDMDQWYVGRGEDSPMERQCDWVSEHLRAAEEIGKKLLGIGEPAAAAVAKGLRTSGTWRENLLPFAKRYRRLPVILETLKLVSLRRRDPLAQRAARLVPGLPAAFSASVGDCMGRSLDVVLDGGALEYRCWDCDYQLVSEERLDPSAEDWAAFVAKLRRLRVDNWSRHYESDSVRDGTNWSLRIDAKGLRANSSGSNAYPEDFGEFLDAVCRLIGGREFR